MDGSMEGLGILNDEKMKTLKPMAKRIAIAISLIANHRFFRSDFMYIIRT